MNTALEFSLDFQEKVRGRDFEQTLQELMAENIDKIDLSKVTETVLAFKDGSGCRFVGHNIELIDKL